MNEAPQSIWRKSWQGPWWIRAWLITSGATFLILLILSQLLPGGPKDASQWLIALTVFLVASLIIAALIILIWMFIRWLFCARNVKRTLFALACCATLIALFYAEEDWRGWHTWNQFKLEWATKGEHFSIASVMPPPVPAEQNFALTPLLFTSYGHILTRDGKRIPSEQRDTNFVQRMHVPVSFQADPTNVAGERVKGTFTKLEGWQQYYRDLAAKTNLFPVPAQSQSPAADVLLALSKYDSVVEELRAASQLPESRFPLNYDSEPPAAILLPHLAALKGCERLLQLRAIAELQNHQTDKALADVQLGLQLAEKIQTEPFLISHLVRIAMLEIMLQPMWEGLARQQWSEAQLVALDAALAKFHFPADYQLSMRGELGLQSGEMDLLRRHRGQMDGLVFNNYEEGHSQTSLSWGGVVVHLIPSGWFYQNQYHCARIVMNYYMPVANANENTFSPTMSHTADNIVKSETQFIRPFNLFERLMLPALGNAATRFARGQSSANLARTAIALERYRLARGNFPEALDALAPQFIDAVPHDVIGGEPLKYRREADGLFVLYSIGWNETDDGGTVVFKKGSTPSEDIRKGDWVWRYPKMER